MRFTPGGERHGTRKKGRASFASACRQEDELLVFHAIWHEIFFSAVPWLMAGLIHLPVQLSSLLANFPLLHNR
jgi:hypothetical protein